MKTSVFKFSLVYAIFVRAKGLKQSPRIQLKRYSKFYFHTGAKSYTRTRRSDAKGYTIIVRLVFHVEEHKI